MNEIPSNTAPINTGSPTPPLSCPRCMKRAGDWCCWELVDLEARLRRRETLRQLLAAFPGRSEKAIRGAIDRYDLPDLPAAPRAPRRKRCACCRTPFAAASGQRACDRCDPPPAWAQAVISRAA